jgi:hypothetical protein
MNRDYVVCVFMSWQVGQYYWIDCDWKKCDNIEGIVKGEEVGVMWEIPINMLVDWDRSRHERH